MKRFSAALVLALVTLVGFAPTALAHARLTASDPAEGAQLAAAPHHLTLTFNEPIAPASAAVTVTAVDGTKWTTGAITAAGGTLTVPVTPAAGPAGDYTIDYAITSADGDAVSGAVRFSLTAPVPAAPTTTPPTTSSEAPRTSESQASTDTATPAPVSGSSEMVGGQCSN